MFSREFQSAMVLVDIVLMQTQQFFHEYSHGDLTAKVLSLKSFVLYSIKRSRGHCSSGCRINNQGRTTMEHWINLHTLQHQDCDEGFDV